MAHQMKQSFIMQQQKQINSGKAFECLNCEEMQASIIKMRKETMEA
jgi:hypothetical protein